MSRKQNFAHMSIDPAFYFFMVRGARAISGDEEKKVPDESMPFLLRPNSEYAEGWKGEGIREIHILLFNIVCINEDEGPS